MPKNRSQVERTVKVDEILDVVDGQLQGGGLDALSVAGAARSLGIAQNSIYWYFPSRDDLLVAAARRSFDRLGWERPIDGPPVRQAIWLFDQLEQTAAVRAAIISRSFVSPVVAQYREKAHGQLVAIVTSWLAAAIDAPDDETALLAEAVLAAGEGLLLRRIPGDERNRILEIGLDRLLRP